VLPAIPKLSWEKVLYENSKNRISSWALFMAGCDLDTFEREQEAKSYSRFKKKWVEANITDFVVPFSVGTKESSYWLRRSSDNVMRK
jgi:hypothetical protein